VLLVYAENYMSSCLYVPSWHQGWFGFV